MKRLHPPVIYTATFIVIISLIMGILAFIAVYSTLSYYEVVKQLKYTNGKVIDLPEELSTVGTTAVLMEATSNKDTIFIYFKH